MSDTWEFDVAEAIEDFVYEKKSFTALEISRAVQALELERGVVQPTRHLAMREYIHEIMKLYSDYTRELVDTVGGNKAYVYRPSTVEQVKVNINHDPTKMVQAVNNTVPNLMNSVLNSPLQALNSNPVTKQVRPDARGSICVPKSLVKWLPGTKVAVSLDNSRLLIHGDIFDTHEKQYTVDYHGNVRLTKSILSKLPIRKLNAFTCENTVVGGKEMVVVE